MFECTRLEGGEVDGIGGGLLVGVQVVVMRVVMVTRTGTVGTGVAGRISHPACAWRRWGGWRRVG